MTTNRNLANRLSAVAAPAAARTPPATRPPAANTKFTVLLDTAAGGAFDDLHLRVKREVGSPVNKSEIVRVLLAIVTEDATLRTQVADRLSAAVTARRSGGTTARRGSAE